MNKKIFFILVGIAIVVGIMTYILWPDKSLEENKEPEKFEYVDLEAKDAYKLISEDKDVVIIDVSPRYDKGRIPNSINHYVGDGSLDEAIPELDKDRTYLVYCHVDSASIPGAQKLVDAGFEKVYRLKDNYPAWIDGGYPIEVGLIAVGDYQGSALATRSFLEDKFEHRVIADIIDPPSGKFYEGWLVDGNNFFSTGAMKKENGKYILIYSSNEDSRTYKEVVITEETLSDGLDNKPETHVLEGKFE
jgi:rhodanese-related sulfurtransferase